MKPILFTLPCFLFLLCEGPSGNNVRDETNAVAIEEFSEMAPAMKSAPRPELIQAEENETAITKKNIKTGGITFKSDDIDADYKKVVALLPGYDAYVENENQTKSEQRINYDLTIRVPSDQYDSLYNGLSNMAERVEHKYTNMQDVTERYYDLQTRIKNKKTLEQRYIDLLSKATAVKDMLEIERQLNEVRTEIENLQGQFNYLSNQVSLSTLQLSFFEILPYTYDDGQRPGFGNRILSALSNGWQGMQLFVLGLITIWPLYLFLALGVLAFVLARKWWRRRK
jgi:hypothetical protein